MSGFDRSKYKATPMASVTEQQKEAEAKTNTGRGDRVEYLNLKEGRNRVRVYPARPGEKSFTYPKTVHFLEISRKNDKGEYLNSDGNVVQTEAQSDIRRRPVFNARVHGGLEHDPIDEYIKAVFAKAEELFKDDDVMKKKYTGLATYFKTGITAKTKWCVYADLYNGTTPEFGRLDLPVTVKDKMNEIANTSGGAGPIQVDPFTDPDTGRAITIVYDKHEKDPKKVYSTGIDLNAPTPLTDPRLEHWSKQESLEKQLVNSYTKRDFNNAMEGLQRYDKKSNEALRALGFATGYEIFADEAFLDMCEKIHSQVKDDEFKDANQPNSFVDDVEDTQPSASQPAFAEKSLEEMDLDELADYIADNNLDITILPDSAPADIVQAIRDEEELAQEEKMAEVAVEQTEAALPRTSRRRASRASELD